MLLVAEEMNFIVVRSSALVLMPQQHPVVVAVLDTLMPQQLNSQEKMKINEIIRHHIMGITTVRTKQQWTQIYKSRQSAPGLTLLANKHKTELSELEIRLWEQLNL